MLNSIYDKVEFNVLDNGIIENRIKDAISIEYDDVLKIKEVNQSLANGKRYVLLISSGPFASISKEARELSASKKFAETTLAKAILIESLAQGLIANFYLSVNKPKIKTRIFSINDRAKALKWLKDVYSTSSVLFLMED